MKEHSYYCHISFGNDSTLETEMMRRALKSFLSSFLIRNVSIKKARYGDGLAPEFFYHLEVCYENSSFLQVLRFSESLIAFCLHWGMKISEYNMR